MGYDSLKTNVETFVKEKNEWTEEFELFSKELETVQDIIGESQKLDDDITRALEDVEKEFDLENENFERRDIELETQKSELSDLISQELKKLDDAQGILDSLNGKKYTVGLEMASNQAKDYTTQLDEMLKQLGASASRDTAGASGAGGVGNNAHESGLFSKKAQDNAPTMMSRYPAILGNHSIEEDLNATNPNYSYADSASPWNNNCQRCVAVYEARRRGYDVTAQPLLDERDPLMIMRHKDGWPNVFKGGKLEDCSGNSGTQGRQNVEDLAASWGESGRGIVRVRWKMGGGHVFIVERVNGVTRFLDPQTGVPDASSHFDFAKGSDLFCMRIDHLDFSDSIHKCCQTK